MSKLLAAVASQNIEEIKIYLKSNITGNPTDSDNVIKQALQKIQSMNLNIWEKHDGATFKQNRQDWTEDYFVDLQVDLRMNFSKERYMHMLEVGKLAFPAVVQPKERVSTTAQPNTRTGPVKSVKPEKKNRTLLYAGIAVVILGLIVVKLIKNG